MSDPVRFYEVIRSDTGEVVLVTTSYEQVRLVRRVLAQFGIIIKVEVQEKS